MNSRTVAVHNMTLKLKPRLMIMRSSGSTQQNRVLKNTLSGALPLI